MSDIVERLRYCHDNGLFDASRYAMTAGYGEAADTIERLRAENAQLKVQHERDKQLNHETESGLLEENVRLREENARLRAALKPFARSVGPETDMIDDTSLSASIFTFGQLRAARAAMGESDE